MVHEEDTVRFGSAEDRKRLAHSMVQELEEQKRPIVSIEKLHKEIKEAKENQQMIEDRFTCKVAGVFREISEELGKRGMDALVKEYHTEKVFLSGGGIIHEFTDKAAASKNNRVLMKSANAYRSLVQMLENDNDAQTLQKRWQGMSNLEITDKALNLAYGIAYGIYGLNITGKYVNQKDEETCKTCCWHDKCP